MLKSIDPPDGKVPVSSAPIFTAPVPVPSEKVILDPPIVLSEDVALPTESNRLPNVLGLVSVNVYVN